MISIGFVTLLYYDSNKIWYRSDLLHYCITIQLKYDINRICCITVLLFYHSRPHLSLKYSYYDFVNRYLYSSTILNIQLIVVLFAVELLLLLSFLFYCYCWTAILVMMMVRRRRMVDWRRGFFLGRRRRLVCSMGSWMLVSAMG